MPQTAIVTVTVPSQMLMPPSTPVDRSSEHGLLERLRQGDDQALDASPRALHSNGLISEASKGAES